MGFEIKELNALKMEVADEVFLFIICAYVSTPYQEYQTVGSGT